MRLQKNSYSCGILSVMNAAKCFRKNLSERVVKKFTATTRDGTNENGIITALNEFQFEHEIIDTELWDVANNITQESIRLGFPVIICCHNFQHWMVVGGMLGSDFIVFDSTNSKRNKKEHGVRVIEAKRLKRVWKTNCNKFFGIVVKHKVTTRSK